MAEIYFNTKTSATVKMTKKDLESLDKDRQKRWRLASESEIELYEKREAQRKMLAEKNKEREKANEANQKKKDKAVAENKKKSGEAAPAADSGSEETANS